MACFNNQSTITRIVLKLEERGSFLIKSMEIEFYRHLGIKSCFSNL